MATLQAATTSTGAIVSDPQAVRELCESYCFGTLNWEVTEDGAFSIWGHDDFEVYNARESGLPDYEGGIVTHEFCENSPTTSKQTRNSMFRQRGSPSAASQSWPSGTSFATAKSSTQTSVPPTRSTSSVVRPPGGVRGDPVTVAP